MSAAQSVWRLVARVDLRLHRRRAWQADERARALHSFARLRVTAVKRTHFCRLALHLRAPNTVQQEEHNVPLHTMCALLSLLALFARCRLKGARESEAGSPQSGRLSSSRSYLSSEADRLSRLFAFDFCEQRIIACASSLSRFSAWSLFTVVDFAHSGRRLWRSSLVA